MQSNANIKAGPQIVRALPTSSRRCRFKAGLGRATSAAALVAGLGGWASDAYAVPAVFFNSDLAAGEQTFIDTAAAADAAYNDAHPGSTQDSAIFRIDLTNSTGSSFAVISGTTTVYVTTTRAGSPALNDSTGDEGGEGFTNWDVDYPSGDWDAAAGAGYTVSFYSDVAHTIPYLVNAVGLNVSDWGTCCAAGTTPDGSVADESQIYMQFNGSDPLLVGGIGTPIDKEEHFVAAIDDRNTFSSVTLIPNGDGELFGVGGILTFSTVQLNSVPDGSSVVDIGDTPDIDTAQTSYTTDELAAGEVNPVFDGGTLTVSAAGTVTNNLSIKDSGGTIDTASNEATFSGVISDALGASGSLTKAGEGTLILTGANSYSGGTTVSAGTLQGNTTSLQGDIANNATLEFAQDSSGTYGGTISGTGDLVKSGTGTVTLSDVQSYTGSTDIAEGTLALSGSGSIASSSGVVADGTFDISATTDGASVKSLSGSGSVALGDQTLTLTDASGSFGGSIAGTGGLTVSGGTETLTGSNSYTGATSIAEDSTLALSGAGSIAASSGVAADGTFDISGTTAGTSVKSLSGSGSVALGDQTLTLTDASGSFGGDISGTGGLTVAGGTETLTGANSYTGATSIGSDGTLALSGSGSIASSSGVGADGTFDISATTDGASVKSLSGSGSVALGDQTLTLTDASGSFGGDIAGTGGLTVSGGTETLSGTSSYTGTTVVAADSTLALSATGSIASSSGVVADGTFDISATTDGASVKSLSGSGSVALGDQTLTLTDASGSFSGDIAGTGGLTVSGGTETLTGTSSYAGATTIAEGGILALSGSGSIASSSGVVAEGTFDISATSSGASVKSLSGSGSVTLGDQTLTLTDASGSFGGAIAGTGGLTVSGGTETLTGSNNYTGATSIGEDSTLALSGAGSIAASSGIAADGTFDISATTEGASVKSLSGSGSVALGDQTLTLTDASGSFGGDIAGTGGLAISGGTETLSGSNNYTGATTISADSTLALSGSGSIAASSGVAADGTFDISGATAGASVKSLSGSGSVALGDQTLTLTDASGSFSGDIAGTGGLTVSGGSETLTGTSSYTGATAVAADSTLALSGSGSITSSRGVAADGTFDISATTDGASVKSLSGSGSVTLGNQTLTLTDASGSFGGDIAGTGGLAVSGGTETLTGANSYTGTTAIAADSQLVLASAGSIAASSDIAVDGVLDIADTAAGASVRSLSGDGNVALGAQTLTLTDASGSFAGSVTGSGGVTVSRGTETLSGTNSYTGATSIGEDGTLALSGSGSIAASSSVAADGTFDISATTDGASVKSISGSGSVALGDQTLTLTDASGSFGGDIGGTGGLTVLGGTETLSGTSSYTGATVIDSSGTLALSGGGSIASSSGVAADGTFDISATTAGTSVKSLSGSGSVALGDQTLTLTDASGSFGGSIAGSGGLTVSGGTETLSGANSYTGATVIDSGGTLAVDGGSALSDASAVAVAGTLRVLSSERSGAISGTGTLELASGTLTIDDDGDSRFDGAITGAGSLAKTGSGTLTLTGANDFAGGLTIDSGAVRATSDASLGTGTMTIGHASFVTADDFESSREIRLTDATATIDSAGHDVTLSGTVSGEGTLNKVGAGTLTLTGENSQNGINVKGGTLAFDSDAALGASGGVITIEENTTLHTLADFTIEHTLNVHNTESASFDTDGHDIVMAGNITGAGTVQKIGAGTLTLTGENSQVVMEVRGGTVIASSQGSVGAAGGDIFLRRNSTFAAGTDMTVTQNLHIAGANATFDTGANSVVLSGTADGNACLIKIGSGRLNLVADASNEIGACVEEGTLSFNSAFTGHVWVEEDGTAGGSGLINGDVDVRGTLAPGNSPGRLVVAGSVTQTDGSNFLVDIDGRTAGIGAGHYDTLVLTGADSLYTADGTLTPKLRGITGDANNNFTPVVGDMFRIVAAEGGVAGAYDALVQPVDGLPENARFDVLYRSNAVYLTVTPGSYAAIFGTDVQRNAAAAGAAVDTMRGAPGERADGGKAGLLDGLMGLDEGQLVRAFSQAAGEVHADAMDSVVQASRSARASVSDHLNAGLGAQGTLDEDIPLSRRLWGAISHDFGTVHADRNGRAYRSDTTAMVIGVDGDLGPAVMFGVAVAYNQSETRTDILGGSEGRSYHALAYGQWHRSDYYANVIVDAGPDVYDIERQVDLSDCSCALEASPDGFSVGADVEVGRHIDLGAVTVTPAFGLGYDGINRDSFIESGDAVAALEFRGDRRDALTGRIGARLGGGFAWGGMTLRPYGSLFVSHELMDAGTELNPSLHGARFDVAAPVAGRTAVRGAAGVTIDLTQDLALGFSYRYRESGNAQNNAFSGSISLRF